MILIVVLSLTVFRIQFEQSYKLESNSCKSTLTKIRFGRITTHSIMDKALKSNFQLDSNTFIRTYFEQNDHIHVPFDYTPLKVNYVML